MARQSAVWRKGPVLLLAILSILMLVVMDPLTSQTAWAKNIPMGHPSSILQLRAGDDPRFDFFEIDEESVEELQDDLIRLYPIIDTVVFPEILKLFEENQDVYFNGYIEYVSVRYSVSDSRLDILVAKQPEEYGCNTEGCAQRTVRASVPDNLNLAQVRKVGMFVAVYENPDRQLVERMHSKALAEAGILLSEAAAILEEKKDELLADSAPIESFYLRQYEDISRITFLFSPFEPGAPAKAPIDIVDTSNTYYKKAYDAVNNWEMVNVAGKFLYSDPPKPDQIFKVYYRIIGGTVENFNATGGFGTNLSFGISAEPNGTLEIKFPRNYPYTNDYEYLSSGSYVPTDGADRFIVHEIDDPPYTIHSEDLGKYCIGSCPVENVKVATDDCFFTFSIPVTGRNKIELASTYLLWEMPHYGDDIPDRCLPQTIAAALTPDQVRRCDELGIPLENCSDQKILEDKSLGGDKEIEMIEEQETQMQNSMYMIGVGAAIAGIFAYFGLKKK